MNNQEQGNLIKDYYDKKCLAEGKDTALNMTLKRFWFNQELLSSLMIHISLNNLVKNFVI